VTVSSGLAMMKMVQMTGYTTLIKKDPSYNKK
jgi:hypothetical protein